MAERVSTETMKETYQFLSEKLGKDKRYFLIVFDVEEYNGMPGMGCYRYDASANNMPDIAETYLLCHQAIDFIAKDNCKITPQQN